MPKERTWYTCPTCHRVLWEDDVCDTPECVKAAEKAAANTAPDLPSV